MAIRRSMAWMTGGQAAFFILQFIGSIIIARLLSPYDVGIFAVAMAVVGLINIVQTMGLSTFLVREPFLTPQTVSAAATVNWLLSFLIAGFILLVAFVGEYAFRERGVRDVLMTIACVPLIGAIAFVPNTMLEREANFRVLALIRAGSTAIGLALTVLLALEGFRYMSFAYSQVVTAILTNTIVMIIARKHLNFRFSLVGARAIVKFGLQVLATTGLTATAARSMEIVLGRVQGLAALGLYSRASGNHNMLWYSVQGIIGRVVFVDFARHVAEGGGLRERYLKVLETITGLLWPLFGGVAILAGPITRIIYGEAWIGAAAPLALLCVASMVLASVAMTAEIFVVRHETRLQVRIVFINTIVGVTLFVLAAFHSLEAAAASRILDALFVQWRYRPHLARLVGTQPGDFRRVYMRSALGTIAACAPAAVLMTVWRFSPSTPFEQILLATVFGMLFWVLTLRLSGHFLFQEMVRFASRFRNNPQVT
ncbi:MAG: oligosaccharide flippase family protein [Sphingorhabdus sp.]